MINSTIDPTRLDPLIHTKRFGTLQIAIIAILAAALVIRAINLGRFDIGTDEAHSFLTATHDGSILEALKNDTNPPLYFFVLKGWIGLFGVSLLAMRALSVVCSVAAVGALGALARSAGASDRTVLWTLMLGAFSPIQLHYAQEVRGYSLAILLLTLGLLTFLRAIRSNDWRAWALHGVVLALWILLP